MQATDPKPLDDYFKQGLAGRRDGLSLRDNPYSAGSPERREWNAGFCATVPPDEERPISERTDGQSGWMAD